MFFAVFLFAIVHVMLVHPVNLEVAASGIYDEIDCPRCGDAYSSVWRACLTLIQTVIVGDGWGDYNMHIMIACGPTVLLFVACNFTVTYGLANLVIAVIVERALSDRELNVKKEAIKKSRERDVARNEFVNLCGSMDEDSSCTLSLP